MAYITPAKFIEILKTSSSTLTLDSDVIEHAAWVIEHVYLKPYAKSSSSSSSGIARYHHGAVHVCRCAHYIPIIVNFYKKFSSDPKIQAITAEEIKIMQLMALWHDSGRENDGEDLWDKDSALNFYHYLTIILKVDPEQAKQYAAAIANKDADKDDPDSYYELNDKLEWVKTNNGKSKREADFYLQVLHDADCLDIIRVCDVFDARYLYLHKNFTENNNSRALKELALLITKVRGLIYLHGDLRGYDIPAQKHKYEVIDCYEKVKTDIFCEERLSFLKDYTYAFKGDITYKSIIERIIGFPQQAASQPEKSVHCIVNQIEAAFGEGRLFSRGIASPTACNLKHPESTATEIEITKANRPQGNQYRSISLLYGSVPFSSTGFLLVDPQHIRAVCECDLDSGFGKKQEAQSKYNKRILLNGFGVRRLFSQLKNGGVQVPKHFANTLDHNEVICDIWLDGIAAIYFTQDPCFAVVHKYEQEINRHERFIYEGAPKLLALYIQQAFKNKTGRELPLIEYSGMFNFVRHYPNPSETEVTQIWMTVVLEFLNKQDNEEKVYEYLTMPLDRLKILAIFAVEECGSTTNFFSNKVKIVAPDKFYPENFRKDLDGKLKNLIDMVRCNYIEKTKQSLETGGSDVLSPSCLVWLQAYPNEFDETFVEVKIKEYLDKVKKLDFGEKSYHLSNLELVCALAKLYNLSDICEICKKLGIMQIRKYMVKYNKNLSASKSDSSALAINKYLMHIIRFCEAFNLKEHKEDGFKRIIKENVRAVFQDFFGGQKYKIAPNYIEIYSYLHGIYSYDLCDLDLKKMLSEEFFSEIQLQDYLQYIYTCSDIAYLVKILIDFTLQQNLLASVAVKKLINDKITLYFWQHMCEDALDFCKLLIKEMSDAEKEEFIFNILNTNLTTEMNVFNCQTSRAERFLEACKKKIIFLKQQMPEGRFSARSIECLLVKIKYLTDCKHNSFLSTRLPVKVKDFAILIELYRDFGFCDKNIKRHVFKQYIDYCAENSDKEQQLFKIAKTVMKFLYGISEVKLNCISDLKKEYPQYCAQLAECRNFIKNYSNQYLNKCLDYLENILLERHKLLTLKLQDKSLPSKLYFGLFKDSVDLISEFVAGPFKIG